MDIEKKYSNSVLVVCICCFFHFDAQLNDDDKMHAVLLKWGER